MMKSNYLHLKNGTAKCKLCQKIIKTSGNSTNMSSHIKNKHYDTFVKCMQKKVSMKFRENQTIEQSFRNIEALKDNGQKANEIYEAIVFMICRDNMPVRCVEKEGLTHLLKKCVPQFKMPGRSKITTMIEEKYSKSVDAVKKILSEVEDVAFTCDAVTITNSSRSFLTITAHFINKECLESICLMAARMDQISDDENSDDQGDSLEKAHNRSIVKVDGSENRELKMYLSLPQTSWESNPIMFWSSYKAAMPGLSKLALRYLTTPGSSVPSERLASAIKCVVCDSRSRMTDTHITERVFLISSNSKYWS
ncbi:E3 SUMO-protein ligase ZBED1-like isoform X2 [Drosophila willistoni]|uniref:E3 SUMO-protein ligase ZBED1-like isoform X2 n=3 Tax=Drosophila willistoni TaxID=7260 RepID=UPI001F07C9DB|nr:E3 SUMO-protein ligase ZBED1-like isoform X2 [Drosophila willistoni]